MLHWASRKRQCARERKQKARHGLAFSEEDTLLEAETWLGGSLFEIDRTGLWCLLVSQREEVPALLLDKINKITITGRGVSVSG